MSHVLKFFALGGAAGVLLAAAPTQAAAPKRLADLRVTSGTVSQAGAFLTGKVTIKNVGVLRTKRSIATLVLDPGWKRPTDLKDRRVAALGKGQRKTLNIIAKLPTGLSAGKHELAFCVDHNLQVKERSEKNNCRLVGSITVPKRATQGAKLPSVPKPTPPKATAPAAQAPAATTPATTPVATTPVASTPPPTGPAPEVALDHFELVEGPGDSTSTTVFYVVRDAEAALVECAVQTDEAPAWIECTGGSWTTALPAGEYTVLLRATSPSGVVGPVTTAPVKVV